MVSKMEIPFLVYLFKDAIWLITPLFFAAVSEMLVEKSGVLNLSLEGIMLISAFTAFAITLQFQNPYLGFLIGSLSGILINIFFYVLFQLIGISQTLAGLSITIFASGLTFFLFRMMIGYAISPTPPLLKNTIGELAIPYLSDLPFIGIIFFRQNLFAYLLIPLLFFFYIIDNSQIGLKIKTIGEEPAMADSLGIDVYKYRLILIIIQGFLCGAAGSILTTSIYNTFLDNITAGLGFIAITMVILGGWNPIKTFISCFLFGFIYALQFRIQMLGFTWLPYQFTLSLPYVATIIFLVLFGRRYKPPSSLGKTYKRIK
jgi:simple sugar transport system permease protein